jgi:cellulose synthase/poly-beta-1,6-N-acetylglucosamine synthase-like glycosyltransferase
LPDLTSRDCLTFDGAEFRPVKKLRLSDVINACLAVQVARHALVLLAHVRVMRFLREETVDPVTLADPEAPGLKCHVVLPMMREQRLLRESVEHFHTMMSGTDGKIVVVTTERESEFTTAGIQSTPDLAAALADGDQVLHMHYTDAKGRKGDQINYAAQQLAIGTSAEERNCTIIVVYDADSRPSLESANRMIECARNNPRVSVFQQSARFRLVDRQHGRLRQCVADGGALRANRFVLSYEIPRLLNRRPDATLWRKIASKVTYGHVTGHGLGLRLDWLLRCPMPSNTIMEDMWYGFSLAAHNVHVVPVKVLDVSDVPSSIALQFRQAERWFMGPSRALLYRRHAMRIGEPATGRRSPSGWASALIAFSGLLISAEWLSRAFALPVLVLLARSDQRRTSWLSRIFLTMYAGELFSAELQLGDGRGLRSSALRLAAYPLSNTLFGVAGFSSILKRIFCKSVRQEFREDSDG